MVICHVVQTAVSGNCVQTDSRTQKLVLCWQSDRWSPWPFARAWLQCRCIACSMGGQGQDCRASSREQESKRTVHIIPLHASACILISYPISYRGNILNLGTISGPKINGYNIVPDFAPDISYRHLECRTVYAWSPFILSESVRLEPLEEIGPH